MKTQFEIIIDASLSDVWDIFIDQNQRVRWQRDFYSYEQVSGSAGHPGSVAKLTFVENDRTRTLTESITERRDASFLAASYASDEGTSLIVHKFAAIDTNQTHWASWGNFRFRGIAKITSLFKANSIKKRMEGDMQRFKLLVETDVVGANH